MQPPLDFIHNEPKFEMEAMLKLKQLWKPEWKYLVKWKAII
jgi:hypothetical protein